MSPTLMKFKSSVPDSVFNGVFYNLDAVSQSELIYENVNELYEFYEQLGEGGFGAVFKAKFLPTGEIIAVKVLK